LPVEFLPRYRPTARRYDFQYAHAADLSGPGIIEAQPAVASKPDFP
jgi:hypothetical protein